ncbi:uncharacterized protein LOC110444797 [Mizuhopecten yessoensis]|uniref:uncharacterized protein LOC110444797 n=1 Tax=Mizuhopecten yessoensis TaxID=6573 RepID=UPI000B45C21C|nr:uncharacterized protein LOC110444797 [Mizuhopecten yessoensis]
MRLFTSTVCLEEFEPRPPFLTDPTRDNLKTMGYTSTYRDHKLRLPTPEKVAIMELSNSFERRRLGKQQQMLTDMNQRCREQEVTDLSNKLTEKCCLLDSENRKAREVEFYRTNFMTRRQKTYHGFPDEESLDHSDSNSPSQSPGSRSPHQVFDKGYKHFPARKVMKHQSRFDLGRTHYRHHVKHQPKVEKTPQHTAMPQYAEKLFNRAKHLASQRINGQVQLDLYNSPRNDHFAPLILPNIDSGSNSKLESITTARLNLGTRSRSTLTHGMDGSVGFPSNKSSFKSTRSTRAPKTLNGEVLSTINVPRTEMNTQDPSSNTDVPREGKDKDVATPRDEKNDVTEAVVTP